ncbi:ectoine/hydroxyectoine ABC transporter substrate-binding protein EhuB [Paenibacillus sp. IB182496]|uniref:Ectoine/hydroxyectoine ABC transporter substrate-binding protein EhuB n=2 Tax=Paenibacillus sabuli TaxID=2772509 RepID=A0A927GS45_9BACL|nr:ectoine/hydroxyectoine ABC transporter substrate-binding protein EhuB [Paenibacillus sabuli]
MVMVLLAVVLAIATACGANNEGTNNGGTTNTGGNTNTDMNTGSNDGGNNADNAGENDGDMGDAESTLEKARAAGTINVGFANEEPYAYQTADGELTGEAVEIARVILNNLGIEEMNGQLTEFGGLIGGLKAERFDIITAGMFINPNRCSEVAFANPEYSIGEAIAVPAGNEMGIMSYADIAEKGAKVAVMTGAIEIEYLEAAGVTEDQMVIVPDQNAGISALQSGSADVFTATGPALQSRLDAAGDSNIERVADFEQPTNADGESARGYGAAAFRQADAEFVEAYNEELQKMKESGQLLEILQEFGFTEAELPGDMTAAELCG